MTGTKRRQLQGRSPSPVRQQAMEIYIFSSVRNSSVSAFTSDSTAANLPIAYAPWQSSMGTALPTWGLADPVMAAIQRDGFSWSIAIPSGATQCSDTPSLGGGNALAPALARACRSNSPQRASSASEVPN
jgi:hypothetical protein